MAMTKLNLNIGCPSDRVQSGRFGACLFKEPNVVAECLEAMRAKTSIPVTVKTRIGVDDIDHYDNLVSFVEAVAKAGCSHFIVHARKAWLQGLSPKQNRQVPPLNYDRVYQLKKDFPQLFITINGGIKTLEDMQMHLENVDGVMIGREAYQNPFLLASIDQFIFGEDYPMLDRMTVLEKFIPYIQRTTRCWCTAHKNVPAFVGLVSRFPQGEVASSLYYRRRSQG